MASIGILLTVLVVWLFSVVVIAWDLATSEPQEVVMPKSDVRSVAEQRPTAAKTQRKKRKKRRKLLESVS